MRTTGIENFFCKLIKWDLKPYFNAFQEYINKKDIYVLNLVQLSS